MERKKGRCGVKLGVYSRFLFVMTTKNASNELDYVTEKVFDAHLLRRTEHCRIMPDRNAAIFLTAFASVKDLGQHFVLLSRNEELLFERHIRWRTRPIPAFEPTILRIAAFTRFGARCLICHHWCTGNFAPRIEFEV